MQSALQADQSILMLLLTKNVCCAEHLDEAREGIAHVVGVRQLQQSLATEQGMMQGERGQLEVPPLYFPCHI